MLNKLATAIEKENEKRPGEPLLELSPRFFYLQAKRQWLLAYFLVHLLHEHKQRPALKQRKSAPLNEANRNNIARTLDWALRHQFL